MPLCNVHAEGYSWHMQQLLVAFQVQSLASYSFWQGKEKNKTRDREALILLHVEDQVKVDICGPVLLLVK